MQSPSENRNIFELNHLSALMTSASSTFTQYVASYALLGHLRNNSAVYAMAKPLVP